MTDYDTTEKVERTDVGYRLTIESTRGTGTRDQDKIKLEARTEGLPTFEHMSELEGRVAQLMEHRRMHDPDGETDE